MSHQNWATSREEMNGPKFEAQLLLYDIKSTHRLTESDGCHYGLFPVWLKHACYVCSHICQNKMMYTLRQDRCTLLVCAISHYDQISPFQSTVMKTFTMITISSVGWTPGQGWLKSIIPKQISVHKFKIQKLIIQWFTKYVFCVLNNHTKLPGACFNWNYGMNE